MNFWLLATAIPLAAAVSIGWPLLSDRSALRGTGITLLILIPVSALFLYQGIGSPQSVEMAPRVASTPAPSQESIEDLLVQLEQRLRADPDDLEGWLMLGRSYKTMQSYEQAETALRKAAGLAPDHPLVLVELAEALLFSSGQPEITDEIRGMLERASRDTTITSHPVLMCGLRRARQSNRIRLISQRGQLERVTRSTVLMFE